MKYRMGEWRGESGTVLYADGNDRGMDWPLLDVPPVHHLT